MHTYALDQNKYTYKNALLWGNCTEHFNIAFSGKGSLGSRTVHLIIALVECVPIISQIASIFEMCIASLAYPKTHIQPTRPITTKPASSSAERDAIPEKIKDITLQLRRKLCPPEFLEQDPKFLEEYDKGLSLEQVLKQFEILWNTEDQEMILFACVNQKHSIGGNVIFRLAGKAGCVALFKIIGTEILKQEDHGQIDKNFKAYFSCHFLEAAIRNNDLELVESLCNIPEVLKAISVDDVQMPGHYSITSSGSNGITPSEYLHSINSKTDPQNRSNFYFMIKGEYQTIDPDRLSICEIEDYLTDEKQDVAIDRLKTLISTSPDAPLSDSSLITNLLISLYLPMGEENNIDRSNFFPQGDLSLLSFQQKLNYLFILKAEDVKTTIDELAVDDQKCKELCSRKFDISCIHSALRNNESGYDVAWIVAPATIEKALKKFYKQIDRPVLRGRTEEAIKRFLRDIPLKTLALIARQPKLQPIILPYLAYMHVGQLAVVIPQLSAEILFQYLKEQITSDSKNFKLIELLATTIEQADYFIEHISIIFDDSASFLKNSQVVIDQYRKKLEDFDKRSNKTDLAAKKIYWDLYEEFMNTLTPLSKQITSQQNYLKPLAEDIQVLRSRSSPSKSSTIDQLVEQIDKTYALLQELQKTIESFNTPLEELVISCDIDIPEEYCCKITWAIMQNPVTDKYGHTYESEAIRIWIQENHTSPLTRAPLQLTDLRENIELQQKIKTWKRNNGSIPNS